MTVAQIVGCPMNVGIKSILWVYLFPLPVPIFCAGLNRLTRCECTTQTCSFGANCGNRPFSLSKGGHGPYATKVKYTGSKGFGIYAEEDIPEDSFVLEYIGEGKNWLIICSQCFLKTAYSVILEDVPWVQSLIHKNVKSVYGNIENKERNIFI